MADRQGTNIAECLAFCSQLLANLVQLEYLMVKLIWFPVKEPFKFGLKN